MLTHETDIFRQLQMNFKYSQKTNSKALQTGTYI